MRLSFLKRSSLLQVQVFPSLLTYLRPQSPKLSLNCKTIFPVGISIAKGHCQ